MTAHGPVALPSALGAPSAPGGRALSAESPSAPGRILHSRSYGLRGFPIGDSGEYRQVVKLQPGYHMLERAINDPTVHTKIHDILTLSVIEGLD